MQQTITLKRDIQTAIVLNNQGFEGLARGNYLAAASAFSEAMTVTKALADAIPTSAVQGIAENSKCGQEDGSWTLEAMPVLSPELLHSGFAVFENCFVAVAIQGRDIFEYTKADCELYTAALVYNLALVYHYSGICGYNPDRLDKALGLYELSSGLIQSLEESRDGLALFMAVANNTASLSLVLSDARTFQAYRTCLKELLKEKRDFYPSFFVKNVMVTKPGSRRGIFVTPRTCV